MKIYVRESTSDADGSCAGCDRHSVDLSIMSTPKHRVTLIGMGHTGMRLCDKCIEELHTALGCLVDKRLEVAMREARKEDA